MPETMKGWKAAVHGPSRIAFVQLEIPADATVYGGFLQARKQRASRAKVLQILVVGFRGELQEYDPDRDGVVRSWWDADTTYVVGKEFEPEGFFKSSPNDICGPGIHFYTSCVDAWDFAQLNMEECESMYQQLHFDKCFGDFCSAIRQLPVWARS